MSIQVLNRRDFIRSCTALGAASIFTGVGSGLKFISAEAAAGLSPTLSPDPHHFFVLIRTSGGMDVTLGLDPWTRALRPDSKEIYCSERGR